MCVDETSKQHLQEMRPPLPVMPGKPYRYDPEYKRNGVSNLFMIFAPLLGFRQKHWMRILEPKCVLT